MVTNTEASFEWVFLFYGLFWFYSWDFNFFCGHVWLWLIRWVSGISDQILRDRISLLRLGFLFSVGSTVPPLSGWKNVSRDGGVMDDNLIVIIILKTLEV